MLQVNRLRNFADLGQGFEKGLPFTAWAKQTHDDRKGNNSKDNPDANCMPLGLMQLHTHPYEKKILQGPGAIAIMYNANNDVRQILTNGQPLPKLTPELAPWWYGYSVGKWEGETLVVTTIGFRDDVAGCERKSSDQHRQNDGALYAAQFRYASDRHHD